MLMKNVILFFSLILATFAMNAQPNNWTTDGGSNTVTEVTTAALVSDGSSAASVTWTSTSNQYLNSNTFNVTPGATVTCSVDVLDNDANGRARLCIMFDAGNSIYGDYSNDQASYQTVSYSGTVPLGASTAHVQIRFYDANGFPTGTATVVLDNVVYKEGTGNNLVSNPSFENWPAAPTNPTITGAVYIPAGVFDDGSKAPNPACIGVTLTMDGSAYVASDFTLNGSAVFSQIVPTGPTYDTLLLIGAGELTADLNLDILAETKYGSDTTFYAGIMPFNAINKANAPDTIKSGYIATFTGIVTASGNYDKTWIQNSGGAMNGALLYNQDFSKSHVEGDSVVFAAVKAVAHDGVQLEDPISWDAIATGKTPVVTNIQASDIEADLAAGTEKAEKWVGQLVKISGVTNVSYDGANYAYTCTYAGINVIMEDLVDYHFGSGFSMTVDDVYDVTGVVAWYYSKFRLAPRDDNDLAIGTPIEENDFELNIYPNPADDVVRFTGEISNVELFNTMGQKMNVLFENNSMTISNIASGIYTARITMQNGEIVNRNIVKK